MRLQLTVFSLLVIAALLVRELYAISAERRGPRRRGHAPRSNTSGIGELLQSALSDALPVYVLLAAVAVLILSFGKPERLPQYAGWAVVLLQAAHGGSILMGRQDITVRLLGLAALICLAYLWIVQLPFFDTLPF